MYKLIYTEKELPQRSDSWYKLRESTIGASDLATILGLTDKYHKTKTFWKRQTGKLGPRKENEAMKRGAEMEGEAKDIILKHFKVVEGIKRPKIQPIFAIHPKFLEISASFDGVDLKNKFITEIKCPKSYWMFKSLFSDGIQDYYYAQVQQQLAIAKELWGITKGYYCAYYPDGAYILDEINFVDRFETLYVMDVDFDEKFFYAAMKVAQLYTDFKRNDYYDDKLMKEAQEEFRKGAYYD